MLTKRPTYLLIITIISWGLNLVHPIPLTANDLDCHCSGDNFFLSIDGAKNRNGKSQNHHSGDVEEEVFSFHQQLVITPNQQTRSVPERNVFLWDVRMELGESFWWVTRLHPFQPTLLDHVILRGVIDGVNVVVIFGILG